MANPVAEDLYSWQPDHAAGDTNAPTGASPAGTGDSQDLGGNLRLLKSVMRALGAHMSWERWRGIKNLATTGNIAFTFSSGTVFTVNDDFTNASRLVAVVGRRVRATVTAGVIYGRITVASFASPNTTITCVWDSGALDSGLSEVEFGPEARAVPYNLTLGSLTLVSTPLNFTAGADFVLGTTDAFGVIFKTGGTNRWKMDGSGHLLGVTDNTFDIGASGATRPRTGYFGTSLVSPLVIGGPSASGTLGLRSTSHATKGKILLGESTTLGSSSAYDEVNVKLGIGTQSPAVEVHVAKSGGNAHYRVQSAGGIPAVEGVHSGGTLAAPTASQAGDQLLRLNGYGYGATAVTSNQAVFNFIAHENFTDAAQGTYALLQLTPDGSTTLAPRYHFGYNGLLIGANEEPETSLHIKVNTSNHAGITLAESTANPVDPTDGAEVRQYMKGDKVVYQYNDGGTVRYKTLTLTGTGSGWNHSTTPP